MNSYQQMLYSALALVEEADLVAIFRATRGRHAECKAIELLNRELDQGKKLMEAFAEPSELYDLFADDWPDFRVLIMHDGSITLDFGTCGPPGDLVSWRAWMGKPGVVKKMEFYGRYLNGIEMPDDDPDDQMMIVLPGLN